MATIDADSTRPTAPQIRAVVPPRRRGRMGGHRGGAWPLGAGLLALLVAVPVLMVLAAGLNPDVGVWSHLAATVLPRYLANTLWLSVGVGTGTLVIGVGTAWLVTMCSFPGRRLFEWALLLPMAVPAYVIAYTYAGLLDYAGPVQETLRWLIGATSRRDYWFPQVRSLGGAIVVMTLVLYPYVYLLARAAFLEQSVCVIEIGRTLGNGPWACFRRIALPLARPAIVTGVTLALMEVLADFGTVDYFAIDTFTTGIYRTWFGLGERAAAAQLAAVLLSVVLALILIERVSRGHARFDQTSRRYRPLPGYPLRGWRGAGALVACGLPIGLGFLLPASALGLWALTSSLTSGDGFPRLVLTSLALAASAAVLAVAAALVVAYARRLAPGRLSAVSARIAALGYAVPGAVIAVGIVVPLAFIDGAIIDGVQALGFGNPGLVLTGTIAGLLYAYMVRFLAVSLNTVEASLGKVTASMDDAARVFGLGPGATLVRVHAPLVSGGLLTAGLLVFVDVLKELPATLILRPFNLTTLAMRTYELAGDERLADAAAPALAIVAAGILPVILLSRAIARSRPGAQTR
ncbi:iron ABC transporter permease [Tistrella bauzanensis]|uniref:Iron ABC transporter permease n=1 Tax=Tistrella arctica TaxID=3133430 RepID=A0ABU9YHA7_9PROT